MIYQKIIFFTHTYYLQNEVYIIKHLHQFAWICPNTAKHYSKHFHTSSLTLTARSPNYIGPSTYPQQKEHQNAEC